MIITRFKLFENVQRSKKILRELDIPDDNEDYIKLKDLLKGNPGYLGKFTEWFFKDEFTFNQLENIYNELVQFKLDKPIEQFNSPEDVYDYITKKNADTKVDQVIKSLPSRSRKLVNQELTNLIFNNIQYSNEIKDFYSKKGGRYKNINDLINDTTNLINNLSGGWNVESIKYDEDELVYKDDTTLILHIDSYDRSCELGSTHWCISTDEYYWDEYTEGFNKQYFIYDFTKKVSDKSSIIGVTIRPNGNIRSAHYRDDSECKHSELVIYSKYLLPYDKEYILSEIGRSDFGVLVEYGFIDEVKRIIRQGYDPSDNNNYAIQIASENGHTEIVKLLLEDPRVDPSDGNNYAIRWASYYGHTETVKLLLEDPRVDPSVNSNYAIRWASEGGHLDVVKLLLKDPRVDPSADNSYAIQLASENGHIEIVKLLLKDPRVDPSDRNNYAIQIASENGHTEIVKLLLKDPRVDPSDRNNSAIQWASERGHIEIVKLLLEDPRVDPSVSNNYAIRWASKDGHIEIVKLLLEDPRVDNNYTIRWASENGHIEIIKLLLEDPRVDPSDRNNYAIQIASENGHLDVVELLLKDPRVDPSDRNNYAIQIASENDYTEIVKLLLNDHRVDPSDRNNYAIRWASRDGHLDVVKLLLRDERVINFLSEEDIKKYKKQINQNPQ